MFVEVLKLSASSVDAREVIRRTNSLSNSDSEDLEFLIAKHNLNDWAVISDRVVAEDRTVKKDLTHWGYGYYVRRLVKHGPYRMYVLQSGWVVVVLNITHRNWAHIWSDYRESKRG